jgi:hypothetical protein
MFDVSLIVLREVVVYIRRESGADRGLGEEGEREEVMRVQSRLRSGLIPSITDLDRFGSIRDRGSKERAGAAKGMLFRGQDSRGVLLCPRAFLP